MRDKLLYILFGLLLLVASADGQESRRRLLLAQRPTSAAPSYLVDSLTGVKGAWSLRKLRAAYAGSAIRVRRSSDDTESDIGFATGGGLDTATLLTFCGAGDGFIRTVYDQVASTNLHQENLTWQPQIVAGGATITAANGKPALLCVSQKLTNVVARIGPPFIQITVLELQSGFANGSYAYGWSGSYSLRCYTAGSEQVRSASAFVALADCGTADSLLTHFKDTSYVKGRVNAGNLYSADDVATTVYASWAVGDSTSGTGTPANVKWQELVIFHSDQMAQESVWQANINSFYSLW